MPFKCVFCLFLRRNHSVLIFDRNLRLQRNFCKSKDFGKIVGSSKMNHNSHVEDGIFAQLTELFGETVSSEKILKVGRAQKWNCK